ncbi:hypothetical protein AN960_22870 [Bacillus sp. FJAT-25509]|nr:hypothetical protein AN960_22870 [Bacillus sp. FJAT-25509]
MIGSEKMLIYYVLLILGVGFLIAAVFLFIAMDGFKDYKILIGGIGFLLIGVLFLIATLPSLKYIVFKKYDVVSGKCVIEIDSSGRSSEADFDILDTDEMFSFRGIPALDAYGKSIPYFCKVTTTKDHKYGISYKIYDGKTRKLILTGK